MTAPDDAPGPSGSSDTTSASGTAHTIQHDWDTEGPLHLTVVSGVAAMTNTEPEALPPLYDAVDPDSLERLLQSVPEENRQNVSIAFPFAGWNVEIEGTGEVTFSPADPVVADD
ncbi:HalOD1 output domain-containing protein [Halorarius litoreus]|uniref:HalOD1 output domain-containing protein n=1 Tax=Halorarius litoreus TaxID=2962676 RepID=UPI0020CECFD3|nr:HalOD1 output domain-containing protein [Halorarius litoreus]